MKQFCQKGLNQRCNRLQNQAKKQPKEFIIVPPCIYDRKIRLKEISQKCVVKRDDISAVFDYILDLWVGPKEPQSRGAALPFFMRHEEEVGRLLSTAAPPSLLCTRISPHHHHQAASTTTTQLTITHLKEQTKIILTSTCSKTHSGLNPINHALLIFLVFERFYRPENALISCFLHSYGHHLDESWWMFSALMREKDKSSHCSCQSIHQYFYTSIALHLIVFVQRF